MRIQQLVISSIILISWLYPPSLLSIKCFIFFQDTFVTIKGWLPEFQWFFFLMSKGKGLLLFSVIIPKAWWLFWLECVRKCLCDCYIVASRKPCVWAYIPLCPWAKHWGKENSLNRSGLIWIGVEINPQANHRAGMQGEVGWIYLGDYFRGAVVIFACASSVFPMGWSWKIPKGIQELSCRVVLMCGVCLCICLYIFFSLVFRMCFIFSLKTFHFN